MSSLATGYEVNYDDKRFTQVNDEKKDALSEVDKTYGEMIGNSDQYYDKLIDNAEKWKDEQTNIQNQQTELALEKIEQQKAQAQKDYIREQSGAYADWQKQSNQYGANAEKMAAQGLATTGYSESSQVGMYNAYQNRVATAREAFVQATLNYDNAMKEARLQNSAALAEIAYQTYQQQLELSLQGFQYKNALITEQMNKKLEVDQMYYSRWQDVLQQINTENAMAEEIRQFNLNYNEQVRQFNEEMARLRAKDAAENAAEIQRLELQKAQLAEEKRQFDEQMAQKSASLSKGSGSSNAHSLIRDLEKQVLSGSKSGSKSSDLVVVNSPYTAEGAAQKVASGELIVTKQEGNRIWVAANPNYTKGQATLDKYTSLARYGIK